MQRVNDEVEDSRHLEETKRFFGRVEMKLLRWLLLRLLVSFFHVLKLAIPNLVTRKGMEHVNKHPFFPSATRMATPHGYV